MKRNRWIELSQRFYLQLLHLYPQAYRESYEMEMFCFFTEQCREAYKQRGRLGILSLWPRTLVDVGATAVYEHLIDPQARVGLLDVRPDSPLPWKGVLLVLIPGLIFFVSQVEQLTSTNDWFFIAFFRAAYFLILPVLLVWLLTRRFPVWGLIPFGLLFKLLGSYNPNYVMSRLPIFNGLVDTSYELRLRVAPAYLIAVSACAILLGALIWYNARSRQIPRTAWKWLGVYGLLILFQILGDIYRTITWEAAWQGIDWQTAAQSHDIKYFLIQIPFWDSYGPLLFVLLIFTGKLFAPKYGGLSFLLLLGYLLPTIVFGRYGEWTEVLPFYVVGTAVLIYRFVVALLAPVWLMRASSISKRQRAAAIPVAIAILTHISLNIVAYITSTNLTSYQPNLLDFAMIIWNQLILAAGLGLAVVLYLPKEQADDSPPVLTTVTA